MKASILVTIEDDTPEEKLIAAGLSREIIRVLYTDAFKRIIDDVKTPGCRSTLYVEVKDNTKEANS